MDCLGRATRILYRGIPYPTGPGVHVINTQPSAGARLWSEREPEGDGDGARWDASESPLSLARPYAHVEIACSGYSRLRSGRGFGQPSAKQVQQPHVGGVGYRSPRDADSFKLGGALGGVHADGVVAVQEPPDAL